ncbi:MAG: hypothetical protein JW860_05475 [Sedimentisphaerales bacterium]|nr:hypothetical protein [Sedimentisphaerales bacterium]
MFGRTLSVLVGAMMVFWGGCQEQDFSPGKRVTSDFYPALVNLHPSFTRFIPAPESNGADCLEAYVSLKDQFGDPIKALGNFRFELYQYQPAMSDPRGRRFDVHGVQTFELTAIKSNQEYWDSTTRNYRFYLELPETDDSLKRIVIQVTYISANNRRMQDVLTISRLK